MPISLNKEGEVTQVPILYSYLIKLLIPVTWDLFISINGAILLFIPICLIYFFGHFDFFVQIWLRFLLLTLILPPLVIALSVLFLTPDHFLAKYSPSYKKKTDFAELFRMLSCLLNFAGRQVARAGEKELGQLVKLRDRLDAAIDHATNCQHAAIVNKTEMVLHEKIDFHHTPARPDGQETSRS
ncbi:MAG: hypothetical protein PHI97_32745 [Desulfobulbus sp.]|nr:hypothetical protein [Desulfobulbus sp.]